MRDTVPPYGTTSRGGAGLGGEPPPLRPDLPRRPARRSRRARLPQHTRRRLERVITAGPASPRSAPLQSADTIVRDGAARFPALRAPPSSTTPRITPGKRVQTPLNNLPPLPVRKARLTRCEPSATESTPARAVRTQRDEIRPRSIRASPPRTSRPEVTSPNRLPPERGSDGRRTGPRATNPDSPEAERRTRHKGPSKSPIVDPAGFKPTTAAV